MKKEILIKGVLFASSDSQSLMIATPGTKVLYLGDPTSAPREEHIIIFPQMTPDYNTLAHHVDGNVVEFERSYLKGLNSRKSMEAFATIIASLANGFNIMLFFPKEVLELKYPYYLLDFFEKAFGIRVQTKSQGFMYNSAFDPLNLRLLFLNNLLGPIEYVMKTEDLDPLTIQKLMETLPEDWEVPRVYNREQPIREQDMVITDLIEKKKQQMIKFGRVLISPFI